MTFFMRGWFANYYSKIYPEHVIKLSEGYRYDSPKRISKENFSDDSISE